MSQILPASALYDDFSNPFTITNTIAANRLWNSNSGTFSISAGTLTVACASTYSWVGTGSVLYNLINSWVQVKAAPYTGITSAQSYLNVIDALGTNNQVDFGYDGNGNMAVRKVINGVQTYLIQFAYNATTHAWWRIRCDSVNFYCDTSQDGITWTNRYSNTIASVPFNASAVQVQINCGHFSAGTDGNSTFQNLNTNATVPNPTASVVGTISGGVFTPINAVPLVGPRSVAPANTKGNLLLIVAAWNNNSTYVPTPAGAVADDQGNWWRYVGDSGQLATGVRVGAWVCSNAQAVQNWLSFCPQGYSAAFVFHVTEIQGVPASYWPLLDFHVASGVASGTTTQTLTGSTRGDPDFVFVATAGQSYATTISSPGSAWTNLFSGSQGSISTDNSVSLRTDWATFAPGSTPSASWTYGGTVGAAPAIMVGITMNNYIGVQPLGQPAQGPLGQPTVTPTGTPVQAVPQMFPTQRPFFPRVVVEGAFGSTPGDNTAAILDDAWSDMSGFALGKQGQQAIVAVRGQQYELSTPEAGSVTVALNNQAGDFNPIFPGSQFYSNALNSQSPLTNGGGSPTVKGDNAASVLPLNGNMSFQNGAGPGYGVTPIVAFGGLQAVLSTLNPYASGFGSQANWTFQLTPNGVTATPGIFDNTFYRIDPNKKYQVSSTVYSVAGIPTGIQVSINWFDRWFTKISSVGGSSVVVGASARVAVNTNLLTPPAGTVYAQINLLYVGTPAATSVAYVSEFALSAGSLNTGLVRLGVPVRVSAFWNGRRYPVGFGYVERWPQDWPDIPQWGWSTMIATDVVGVASSVNLPSAVQGEMLADAPYFCFPFNEQYTSPSTQARQFQGADGMFAVNVAQGNQRPAIYRNGVDLFMPVNAGQSSGNTDLIATGQAMGLLGDSGTGMGNSSNSALSLTVTDGSGAIYGPDPGLPSGVQSYEFWVVAPPAPSPPVSATNVKLMDVICQQDLTNKPLGDGVLFSLGLQYPSVGNNVNLWVATNSTALAVAYIFTIGQTSVINGTVFDITAWHVQAQVNTGSNQVKIYVNGALQATVGFNAPLGQPVAVTFGQATYSTGILYNTYQYSMAYGTLLPAIPAAWRTWAHVQAGLTGFANDGTTDRALRYVAWGGLNLGLCGPQDTVSDLGPAYSTAGASLASAINNDCAGFGSRWAGTAGGNLTILTRQSQYNQQPLNSSQQLVFGDAPTPGINLNFNPGFEYALTGWSTINGSLALDTNAYSGNSAGRLTANGSGAASAMMGLSTGSANIPVGANTWYEVTFWLMSLTGLSQSVTVNADWYNGVTFLSTSTSQPVFLQPGVWTPVVLTVQAPGGSNIANLYAQITGTPASGTQLLVDLGTFRKAYEVIPYQPAQAFDYDNTYVNNELQSTISIGSASGAAPLVRDLTSVLQYFQRGPFSQSVSGTTPGDAYDQANWNLNRYKQPSLRVRQIEVIPSAAPYSFSNVLSNDVGDVANASRNPLNSSVYNAGAGTTGIPVVTQRVETRIGPGVWSAQYQLSPGAPQNSVLETTSGVTNGMVIANNSLAW